MDELEHRASLCVGILYPFGVYEGKLITEIAKRTEVYLYLKISISTSLDSEKNLI